MTFDEWWQKNQGKYTADACHMSEYHMAAWVWEESTKQRSSSPSAVATMAAIAADNAAKR